MSSITSNWERTWLQPASSSSAALTPWDMHAYQVRGVKHGLEHPFAMYWLDMGLGKTVVALSVIFERMHRGEIEGVLITAPKRVCQTVWAQEAQKWSHTKDLKFSVILGTPKQRARAALMPADVYLINYENLPWLVDFLIAQRISKGLYPPFNMAVFDEVTLLKDWSTKRHEAIRKILPYLPYRLGLTGTPASNGYLDLFGQYLAIDSGARLDYRVTYYRDKYFDKSFGGWSYALKPGAKEFIHSAIADITLEMSAKDYLDLPDVIYNNIPVELPRKAREQYDHFENEMFIEMDSGVIITAENAAVLTGKCLQAANGAMYDPEHNWEEIHTAKLEALEDIVEESGGQPLLVIHNFISDYERIKAKFPYAKSFHDYKAPELLMKDWNDGNIQMLLGHPKSMGHGLNLQYGGHTVVWFGLNWSLDLYLQTNARVARQGQTLPVVIHHLMATNTMDETVLEALSNKAVTQDELRKAINKRRKQR